MATRKNISHDTRTREKIRTSQLINRLEKYVFEEDGVEMTKGQVTAALGLIKKTLPDLSQVDGNMAHQHGVSDELKKWFERVTG